MICKYCGRKIIPKDDKIHPGPNDHKYLKESGWRHPDPPAFTCNGDWSDNAYKCATPSESYVVDKILKIYEM